MLAVEWFLKGGVFMWPLLLCSIVATAVIVERGWVHWKARLNYPQFLKRLKQELAGCPMRAPKWLSGSASPVAKTAAVYLRYIHAPPGLRNEALKREGNRYLLELEAQMKLLSSIAHVSPLLGLLGTVAGLVAAFYQIEAAGGYVNPSDLAGGIWEALITTVAGLLIGIPCLLTHQFFHARVEKISREMQDVVSELDEMLAVGRILPPSTPEPSSATSFAATHDEVASANDTYEVL
ncbi:MAG: MotA/TolQ/ExbB proton channel family protein [Methylacidiphilales bacterium]|nr:MotA/TolQ/ExbB proton channel family protein [Candidatus Methylacidiphilales bacterium]MDW8349140.1 MotA/TolQ/ExbB proton channel family protein [Verrucomicrobiae bacterium]